MDIDVLERIYDTLNDLLDRMREEERQKFLKDCDDCFKDLSIERNEEYGQF